MTSQNQNPGNRVSSRAAATSPASSSRTLTVRARSPVNRELEVVSS